MPIQDGLLTGWQKNGTVSTSSSWKNCFCSKPSSISDVSALSVLWITNSSVSLRPCRIHVAIYQPPYMTSLLHFCNTPRQLRSSTSQQLYIPRTKLNLGKRAFSVAAPIIWNELPKTLKSCKCLASFRKNLKTYILKIAFRP